MKIRKKTNFWQLLFIFQIILFSNLMPTTEVYGQTEVVEETTLVVHYESSEEEEWAIWAWPEEGDGGEYVFEGSDNFGEYAVVKIPGAHQNVGFLLKTPNTWDNQTSDFTVNTSTGLGQVWLTAEKELLTSAPEGKEPTTEGLTINYHYLRQDNQYTGWNLFTWTNDTDGLSKNFEGEEVRASFDYVFDSPVKDINFLVRLSTDEDEWVAKDVEEDRKIQLIPGATSQDVWLVSGESTVYYNSAFANTEQKMRSVEISTLNSIDVRFTLPVSEELIHEEDFLLVNSEGMEVPIHSIEINENLLNVQLNVDTIDLKGQYTLNFKNDAIAVGIGAVVRTPEFDEVYYFDGELGALYTPTETTFRVWAPTATSVQLNIYQDTLIDAPLTENILMVEGEAGTYEVTLQGDQVGVAYTYELTFPDGAVHVSNDPYAKATVVNGARSVVVDLTATNPNNFGRMPSFSEPTDAIIYEMHIRDFSIHPNSGIQNKGKYLGVIEEGTQTPTGQVTGIDYLKELGITHVQILPMYDYNFRSVDETNLDIPQYNWGYDPQNYNVPEGSYSTDPTNPTVRINEIKQMIQGLHDAGIRVIMDVVYNHVAEAHSHAFHQTVPGYYYRYNENGGLSNGTGVGNDVASERAMARKYIVDSVVYWTKEFNLDGFRFDLMGIHDVETMNQIREELDKIDPSIIVLGEGWDLGTPLSAERKANQKNASQMPRIAHFNDSIRDLVKGSTFDHHVPGFINGVTGDETLIGQNIFGGQNLDSASYTAPNQVIQYVEAHDNFTLYDKLDQVNDQDSRELRTMRHLLGSSIPLLSQGVPFIHAGQEFMRTKYGDENSYRSPDSINQLDWDRAEDYKEVVNFFKKIIQLRKSEPLFRLTNYDSINNHMSILTEENGLIAYELKNQEISYLVFFNGLEEEQELPVSVSDYELILSNNENAEVLSSLAVNVYRKNLIVEEDTETTDESDSTEETDLEEETVTTTDSSNSENTQTANQPNESSNNNEEKKGNLPQTGEQINWYLTIGGLLVVGIVLGIVYYRRKTKQS